MLYINVRDEKIDGRSMRVFNHPELGMVLYDNSGAAGAPGDNAYSAYQGPPSIPIEELASRGAISPALASDGWWWVPTIRASAVRGELTPYEAAWRILELRRPGRVSAAHPDDQDEAREIAESITRERALTASVY